MKNMCPRTTVWEGPCPPQQTPALPLPEEESKTIFDVLHEDMLNEDSKKVPHHPFVEQEPSPLVDFPGP